MVYWQSVVKFAGLCDHDTLHCPAAKARRVSLCLSGAQYLSCFIYFSLPFMLSLCMLYLHHPSLTLGLVYPCKPSFINNYVPPHWTTRLSLSFPSIFWWLSAPLILNHVSRCGFNDPGECGSTKRCPAAHVVSTANSFRYLLNLVLGLWPENVFQINSVKSWMNLLTFVSDNVPRIGSHLSLADVFCGCIRMVNFLFQFLNIANIYIF